jgi:hypothetical protein
MLRKLTARLAGTCLLALSAASTLYAADYPTTVLSYNPLAYWRFNETTTSPAINTVTNHGSAGTGIVGYPIGGALTGQPGIVGNSVRLLNPGDAVGDAPTHLDVPFDPSFNTYPPFSIEFWCKPNSLDADANGSCPICSLDPYWFEGGNRSGFLFYINGSGQYQVRVGGESSYTAIAGPSAATATTVGQWSHIVATFDGTTLTLFINGAKVATGTASANPFKPNLYAPLRIGATTLSGDSGPDWVSGVFGAVFQPGGNRGFDGWVDEVAIYTNILDLGTITSHYQGGTPNTNTYDALIASAHPVLYLNLDEPAYTAPDPSTYPIAVNAGSLGADANGTNTLGLIADQPGVPYGGFDTGNKSVYFTGEQGNVSIVNPTAFPSVVGSPITLMAWVKLSPQSWSWEGDIIAQGLSSPTSTTGTDGFAENFLRVGDPVDWEGLGDPDTTYYEIGAYADAATGYSVSAISPVPASDIGNWVFLAGTWDGANWNLYRNGILVAQTPDTVGPVEVDSTSLLPNGNAWSIGSRSSPDTYWGWWFGGYIDEPAIFNVALTQQQISDLYNAAEAPPAIAVAPFVPSITDTPGGTVYTGYSVDFTVAAVGAPPLTYSWYENGVALSSTTTNLVLTGLTTNDSATYSVVVSNAFGAVTSSVPLLVVTSAPVIFTQPTSETRYAGSSFSFNVGAVGSLPISYQWNLGATGVGGDNPGYTNIASTANAGTYSVTLTNAYGSTTSSNVTLTVITPSPSSYPATVLADHPLAYYRLGEGSGTVAYDYAGGFDGTYVGDLTLGAPGYSLVDTNTAVTFGGADNYVTLPPAISFSGTNTSFSLEAWANGPTAQVDGSPIICKGTGNNGGNATEQFFLGLNGGNYVFFVRAPNGAQTIATADSGPDGAWHHLVATFDPTNGLDLYIDGVSAATAAASARGIKTEDVPASIGAERSGVAPTYDLPYTGTIDEVAIYAKALTPTEISAHFAAAYGPNSAPFVAKQPVGATNYVGLPVTLAVDAGGTVPLTYQWYQVGVGPVSGATESTYTVDAAAASDAGTYYVAVGNSVSTVNSSNATVVIIPSPTNPPVVPGLVLHLPFDGDLIDKTGRGNNGTFKGATVVAGVTNRGAGTASFVSGPFPGHQALHYSTAADDTNNLSFNYVTLGNRPDLQFGTENFTVAYWVQLDQGYNGGDLPFFSDTTNSTGGFGYNFAPSYGVNGTVSPSSTTAWNGAWGVSLYDDSGNGVRYYGDQNYTALGSYPINDGAWHFLVHVFDRSANLVTYLDGVQSIEYRQAGTSIKDVGNLDSGAIANIGQDPTGFYGETGEALIAELGVWNRALTPLEAASLYVAGVNSNFFYANSPVLGTFTFTNTAPNTIVLTFSGGTLQSTTNLGTPFTTVTTTSPYTVSTTNGAAMFYRVKF